MAINVTQGLINHPTERQASNQAGVWEKGGKKLPSEAPERGGRKQDGLPSLPNPQLEETQGRLRVSLGERHSLLF